MKKLLFLILINIIYISPVWADKWTFVSESESKSIKVYVDQNSIRSDGNIVVWWQLDSYKDKMPIDEKTIFSNIAKSEGDCLRMGRKDLYITYYDQKMGKGNKVEESRTPDEVWTYNQPGSVYYNVLSYVCERK